MNARYGVLEAGSQVSVAVPRIKGHVIHHLIMRILIQAEGRTIPVPRGAKAGMAIGQDEWERRFRELLPKVFNYFRYRLDDDHMAEELTSATFEKAWKSRRRYRREKGAFTTWIFSIARNTATDYFRRGNSRAGAAREDHGPITPSTEEVYARQEEAVRLRELLSRLGHRDRELIGLKYGAELTNRKIAELTGLTETNVGTILHRLVCRLREEWEAEDAERR
jgi:RNA polymerase sigma-70 factor (ECF subfamily)